MACFFEFPCFGKVSDGDVGGYHVRGMGFRSLQEGREKLKFLFPFPNGAHWAESEI